METRSARRTSRNLPHSPRTTPVDPAKATPSTSAPVDEDRQLMEQFAKITAAHFMEMPPASNTEARAKWTAELHDVLAVIQEHRGNS